MDPQTVIPDVATKTPLARKALIVVGATVGLILAGGFAFFKMRNADDETVVESDASES